MSYYTALLDSNVLYQGPVRDIFMELALTDLYKAKWTEDIHREWTNALARDRPDLSKKAIERTRKLMDQKALDSLVSGYEHLIPSLELPHESDRHVLAAAIVGQCDVIVTSNQKHFPSHILESYEIETQIPDEFLSNHLSLAPEAFCSAIRSIRARLQNPPVTADKYLENLRRQGLRTTSRELKKHTKLL